MYKQMQVAPGEKRELLPRVNAPVSFNRHCFFKCRVMPREFAVDRLAYIALEVRGTFKVLLYLLFIFSSWLQGIVDFGEVFRTEIGQSFSRCSIKGKATTLCKEAHGITVVNVVGSMCYQDNGMTLIRQFTQELHHFAFQAGVQASSRFIQEENTRVRTVDQNIELCYTARNRSWPPHGVSYDQLRKTRIYRLF